MNNGLVNAIIAYIMWGFSRFIGSCLKMCRQAKFCRIGLSGRSSSWVFSSPSSDAGVT